MAIERQSTRVILRAVLIVVLAALAIYIMYRLRRPLSWLVIAAFLAIAMTGPVNLLERIMKRGFAIALAYVALILIPIGLGIVFIPSLVGQAEELAQKVPEYAKDVTQFVNDNDTLNDINEKYDVTSEIEKAASQLPSKIGDAATVLKDIGVEVVNSIFMGVTILVLSVFMVAGGPRWKNQFLAGQTPDRVERLDRAAHHVSNAIGNYIGGAIAQAGIAALAAFVVLTILGAPFAAPLAMIVFFFDLIPVVGATIGAVLIGVVMLFVNFPVGLIVWVIFAIVFQQLENYLIQPQIQKRAAKIEPFITLTAVLFGSTLFGVIGAILAIPTAAALQIVVRELIDYRRESQLAATPAEIASPGDAGPGTGPGIVPA